MFRAVLSWPILFVIAAVVLVIIYPKHAWPLLWPVLAYLVVDAAIEVTKLITTAHVTKAAIDLDVAKVNAGEYYVTADNDQPDKSKIVPGK